MRAVKLRPPSCFGFRAIDLSTSPLYHNSVLDKHEMKSYADTCSGLIIACLQSAREAIVPAAQCNGVMRQMINPEDRTHQCPDCGEGAIILVDIETETVPELDNDGNKQYGCPNCHRTFSVDADGAVVQPPPDDRQ